MNCESMTPIAPSLTVLRRIEPHAVETAGIEPAAAAAAGWLLRA